MGVVIQVIIAGISVGAVYCLFALAISLLYRLTGVIHLALGELAGLCVFATVGLQYGSDVAVGYDARLPFAVSAPIALAVVAGAGALIYLIAIKPFLRRGSSFGWIGGIVAAALTVRGLVAMEFEQPSYVLPFPVSLERFGPGGVISLRGGTTIQARVIVVGVAALLLVALTGWLVERSRFGKALRALSQDRVAARLAGVPVEKTLIIAFTGAALLAGAAGLVSVTGTPVTVNTGTILGLKGLLAAVAAGYGRPRRILFFSLVLGLVETALANLDIGFLELGPAYRDVLPIALILVFMAFRPIRDVLMEERT
jgi:branched-chain amino acid transport system permease protein